MKPGPLSAEYMTKVLVIDDDSMVRETIVRLLILEGYQVIESAYGQAGYADAISEQPNIILLDLNMPIMDGLARERQSWSCVEVLIK